MKSVLILEDNQLELNSMVKLVKTIDTDMEVYTATNLGDACTYSVNYDISLFIVDIILDSNNITDISGIEFVKIIRAMPRYKFVPVIFVTGLEDPSLYAYRDLHCYSYINKPLHYADVEKVIKDALEFRHPTEDNEIVVQKNKVIFRIEKTDIVYFCSHKGKITIKTINDQIDLYYYTLKKILQQLKSDKFVECNRGTVVNTDYIANVNILNNEIKLVDNFGTLKIGSIKKKHFTKSIMA